MKKEIKLILEKYNIDFNEKIIDQLEKYIKYLYEENKKINLTSIKDENDILTKHILDSLILTRYIKEPKDKKAIDIGTGAGFPGLLLAIYYPEMEFYLLDSIKKKTDFLLRVVDLLGLKNVFVENDRAEEFAKKGYREFFDYGFSRAVSELRVIVEYVIPLLKINSKFICQKSKYIEEEASSANAFNELKCTTIERHEDILSQEEILRNVLIIEKTEKTAQKYPRRSGIPKKRPL